MVVVLLTVLTLAVLQLGLALFVRNTVLDTAAEGARFAALAGNSLDDGVARTRELLRLTVGDAYTENITADYAWFQGQPSTEIRVVAPLPVLGLLGPGRSLEVAGHAPVEVVD
ncbi:pilus assembly protein [Cryobacterium tepidiphilum]|uniref:Pilus assembly protein n=2 Tax=Cryobacterium tepidiphilum TaxID=2486026 RepID=A0A3M8L2Z4_9MICO|nr:pilus assembly protein [Cryobacterium tepidiphilum]